MSSATFTCDRCGKDQTEADKKEVFVQEDGHEVKQTLCPTCLDEVMDQADRVQGVEGDDKKAAVALDDAAEATERETYGERGEDSTGEGPRS